MICTEVGELMQRQLDYDLDEQELTMLMTHLGDCKACQTLFERLTLLSGSLEQLPRVTPSISIVDSILPELDAIDRQRAQRRVQRVQWKRWMTTAASVAAAAAVVLVMTNLAGNSNQSNNSVPELAMVQKKAATEGQYDVMPMADAANSFSGDAVDEMYHNNSQLNGYHIEPLSSPIESLREEMRSQAEQNEQDISKIIDYAPDPTSVPEQRTSSSTEEPTSDNDNAEQMGQSEGSVLPDPKQEADYKNESEIDVIDQNGNLESIEQESLDTEFNHSFGIASDHGVANKHLSPDGKVYIAFVEHTIVLYETSTGQELRTWDLPGVGNASFNEWTADSSSFSYEWTNESGESSLHSIPLNN